MKKIILCADDFGQNEAVSQAIIQLAKKQRITATSCLTTTSHWPQHANSLKDIAGSIDIGLHFNLTEGKPLTSIFNNDFPTLKDLIIAAYTKKLNQEQIYQELLSQLAAFKKYTGNEPAYIDGHQHIHQLPVIRDALIQAVTENLTSNLYLRIPKNTHPLTQFPKNLIINSLGANKLLSLCKQHHIAHNTSFAGVYNFSQARNYRRYFQIFLQQINHQGIIMCHPGLVSNDETDPIYFSRAHEYYYFMSEDFLTDCKDNHVSLARFCHTHESADLNS